MSGFEMSYCDSYIKATFCCYISSQKVFEKINDGNCSA